ncbi:signal transduction histidine kinase [Rhodoblastus acidophilus]|uniref:sensor histidine kinase n=1 Tax=Rhodoblastus acidophilus TaxID=1074 RepID=UPI002223F313|nr:HAMP domain-containing sensor histidine kinase [Rhodoblastus acidophilus]MCW2318588.1 signal transduction histidine kinase [Rhodoblastus acidophilus]
MKAFLRRFRPDHMTGQIVLLVLAAILIFHFSVVVADKLFDAQVRRQIVDPADVVAGAAIAVESAAPTQGRDVIARLAQTAPWARLSLEPTPPEGWSQDELTAEGREIAMRLGPNADVREPLGAKEGGELFAIGLKRGDWLRVSIPEPRRTPHLRSGRVGGLFPRLWERLAELFFICVLILWIWISAAVASPLVLLAKQAERFPEDMESRARTPETGPREVVELARAINRMQDRIRSMIAARSHALAAISHDLRTIITRIRLRSEFIEDIPIRGKMLRDLQCMDHMLKKNLEFLRDGDAPPDRGLVDIGSLLQTLADEFSETGPTVAFLGGPRLAVLGSFPELQRLFSNLIENARRYGERVEISLRKTASDAVEIDIGDDGPGIALKDRAHLLEPFMRGEPARNMNENEGFGLGLSIARNLAQRANGDLTLLENIPHGLLVRVRLPLADDNATTLVTRPA